MTESYDYRSKKIVAVLSSQLEQGIALNVLGHLALSIGAYGEKDLLGRSRLIDASGISHLGIAKYPFIVTKGKPAKLRRAVVEARANPVLLAADYPKQMLETGHDDDLARAIAAAPEAEMEYLGMVIYGPAEDVNAITKGFSLWRPSDPLPL